MTRIPWEYEEIQSSLIGLVYYLVPCLFIVALCVPYRFNIFSYFTLQPRDIPFVLLTILGELSVITMLSGCLTLVSQTTDWTKEIGNIAWIDSIRHRNKIIAPFVPVFGAFFEEVFFRGIVFLLVYVNFPEYGFLLPLFLSNILFALQQVLFTNNRKQALSMALGSVGIATVACTSIVYTASILPCLLSHITFLIFYFGRFKLY